MPITPSRAETSQAFRVVGAIAGMGVSVGAAGETVDNDSSAKAMSRED